MTSDDDQRAQSDFIENNGRNIEDGQYYLTALLEERNGGEYAVNRYRGWRLTTFSFDRANGRREVRVIADKDGRDIVEETVADTKPLRRFLPWASVEIESEIEQNRRTATAVLDEIDRRENHDE